MNEALDEDVLSKLQLALNVYPPDDFIEMYKWRDLGINSTAFDLKVMDPTYWKAIFAGRSEAFSHEYWKEAQAASAGIFGRGRGAISSVVMEIEPVASLIEGRKSVFPKVSTR